MTSDLIELNKWTDHPNTLLIGVIQGRLRDALETLLAKKQSQTQQSVLISTPWGPGKTFRKRIAAWQRIADRQADYDA